MLRRLKLSSLCIMKQVGKNCFKSWDTKRLEERKDKDKNQEKQAGEINTDK